MEEKKPKPKLTFYILSKTSQEPVRDFQQLLYELRDRWFLNIIQKNDRQASISNNMGYSSELTLTEGEKIFENKNFHFVAKLVINPEDEVTFNAFRQFLWHSRVNYKIYDGSYQSFIPKDPELILDKIGYFNKKVHRFLAQFKLTPVYYYQKTKHYYALNEQKEVLIINPYLLDFIIKKEITETNLEEISYRVAANLSLYAGMFEKKLLPTRFYEYYKKSFKIINNSYFDINNPGRKVFIKPLIFEFDQESCEFYTYAGDSSSSLLFMDKIRPGESLDQAIKRILRVDLKIADDYLGAYVNEYLEFDRDKEGIITPRLIVIIYVGQIKNKQWAKRMSQTSWRSLDGKLSTLPPRNKKIACF